MECFPKFTVNLQLFATSIFQLVQFVQFFDVLNTFFVQQQVNSGTTLEPVVWTWAERTLLRSSIPWERSCTLWQAGNSGRGAQMSEICLGPPHFGPTKKWRTCWVLNHPVVTVFWHSELRWLWVVHRCGVLDIEKRSPQNWERLSDGPSDIPNGDGQKRQITGAVGLGLGSGCLIFWGNPSRFRPKQGYMIPESRSWPEGLLTYP